MFGKLRLFARRIKRELLVYYFVLKDPRTPKPAKFLLWLAIGYAFLPFDIIPDFIPVIGQLDDIIIVPGLIVLALKLVPKEIVEDCRIRVENVGKDKRSP
ncbi:MAG: YkvA family protein [Chloroflexota bacterium]|nr:YkvA family protein [Chloroflexota bacterium]